MEIKKKTMKKIEEEICAKIERIRETDIEITMLVIACGYLTFFALVMAYLLYLKL